MAGVLFGGQLGPHADQGLRGAADKIYEQHLRLPDPRKHWSDPALARRDATFRQILRQIRTSFPDDVFAVGAYDGTGVNEKERAPWGSPRERYEALLDALSERIRSVLGSVDPTPVVVQLDALPDSPELRFSRNELRRIFDRSLEFAPNFVRATNVHFEPMVTGEKAPGGGILTARLLAACLQRWLPVHDSWKAVRRAALVGTELPVERVRAYTPAGKPLPTISALGRAREAIRRHLEGLDDNPGILRPRWKDEQARLWMT